ncbi:tetratricopeptide repeat protein [Candidatus Peregrinibacteria bacterium]|jgi:protein O-GlcNAc transferase|nr:tetratricopeptide repeat protein [Candidatus Peregrinibacteria bacterium]MBT4632144.1 tetratricopeptide repeat protein [Candidatus Peregrinibacteria bacterium]MBT5517067.1 tetratricopeptide repeat protein [Candidatus Peregrinibacteria bacterium]MBT5824062.1 tetratricopeptide repeat protein [Candidatus Peregrinibacteria bacterium]
MKSKNAIQFGIVSLASLLSLAAVFFTYSAAKENFQAESNLFKSNLTGIEEIAAPVSYETRIAKGDQLVLNEYYTLAASEYALAIQLLEENPEGHSKLGETYLKLDEDLKAQEQFKRARELDPQNSHYATNYAISLIHSRNYEAASNILNEHPESGEALFYSALLDGFNGAHEDAQKKLSKTNENENTVDSSTFQSVQNAYINYNSQQDGQEIYIEALLTNAFIDLEEFELAEDLARKTLEKEESYRDVWIMLGYALLKTKNFQESEDAFKAAKNLDSINPNTHYFLGSTHFEQNEFQDAVNSFELALLNGFEPQTEAYRLLAESYLELEQYEAALEAYEYLIKIDQTSIDLFVKPVWLSLDILKDLDRALSIAEESASLFPNESMSHNLLAWVHIQRDELPQAQNEIDKALTMDPKLPEAHFNKAMLEEKKGNTLDAHDSYKTAYELAGPDNSIKDLAAQKFNELSLSE